MILNSMCCGTLVDYDDSVVIERGTLGQICPTTLSDNTKGRLAILRNSCIESL